VTLHGKGDFTSKIKLKTRDGRISELSRPAQSQGSFRAGKEGGLSNMRGGWRDDIRRAQPAIADFQGGGEGHKPRNASDLARKLS
jgi:hypothetical protein